MQTVETLNEGLKRAYTLKISAKDINARVDQQIKQVAPQIRMPGFRPGKVPANLVRRMHGPQIQQEALQSAVQESIQSLIAEQQLRPAMQPAVELEEYAPGQDAEVKVSLEVLPAVPTPAIDGLKLERLTVEVDDATVDEAVARIAGQQKSFDAAPADHAAQAGDVVVMDYEGKVDGELFDGGKGEGMSVELGSGRLIPGFEDQLVGVKANEQRTLSVTFPEDYNVAYLKGKPATFDVTVNEVRIPREAAADEEFAKSLGLESLEQLRGLLRDQVAQELNGLTRTHMKRKLLDQLAASHDFEVPPSMVEAEFNQIWQQLEHEAGQEDDPAAARAEMEKDRDDYRKIAERRVRLGLLLSEIGQKEGVEVSNQEMSRLVAQASQQYGQADRERFVQYVQSDPMAAAQLRAPLYEDKVVDLLFGKAEISERGVTRAELEAAIEAEDGDVKPHVHGPDCGHDHDGQPVKKAAGRAKAAKKPAEADAPAEAAPEAPAAEAKPVKAKKAAPRTAPSPEESAQIAQAAAPKKPAAKAAKGGAKV